MVGRGPAESRVGTGSWPRAPGFSSSTVSSTSTKPTSQDGLNSVFSETRAFMWNDSGTVSTELSGPPSRRQLETAHGENLELRRRLAHRHALLLLQTHNQALDRTAAILRPDVPESGPNDYVRHGTMHCWPPWKWRPGRSPTPASRCTPTLSGRPSREGSHRDPPVKPGVPATLSVML